MIRYEYKNYLFKLDGTNNEIEKTLLNRFGNEGWEMVNVLLAPNGNGYSAFFKRPLK